jgi:hypothetical protein
MAYPPLLKNGVVDLELLSAASGIMVQRFMQLTEYKFDRARQRAASRNRAHTLMHPKQQQRKNQNVTLT